MHGYWKSKPPAGTAINWGHPLTRGLKRFWIWDNSGVPVQRDLVAGVYAVLPATEYSVSASPRGTALSCASTGATRVTIPPITTGTTFTIEQWWYFRSFRAAYGSFFVDAGATSGFWYNASAVMSYYFTTDHLAATTLLIGQWYHIVFSCSGGAGTFYLNGQPDGTVASVPSIALTVVGSDSASERLDGWNELMRVWIGRALNQAEVQSLYLDRYGMMAPPVWRRFFVPAAAGGAFQPAWAARANQLISGGMNI